MMLDIEEAIARVVGWSPLRLLAIDGLPLAGKSTLAHRLATVLGADRIELDEFVRPEAEWPSHNRPSFPFDYIRYSEFMAAVKSLATHGACSFRPYDWQTGHLAPEVRNVRVDRPVIVEGVSALHPGLAPLYDLRIWIESDAASTLSAAHKRGVGPWAQEWQDLFLPSVELYLQTRPREHADIAVRGRGK